jgi:hypothetical protein
MGALVLALVAYAAAIAPADVAHATDTKAAAAAGLAPYKAR